MALAFATFTDAFTGTAIDINPDTVNIDAAQAVPASQLPTGVANATRIWVRSTVHVVVGTLAATIAALIAAAAGGGGAPSNAIYVDATNGNNATGQRGNPGLPFLTMAGAMGVAQSGDEILVSPGTYSGAFSVAAVANLIIRGGGEFAGETILTAGNGVDVCTLNAANRSLLFDTIQISGATTGRGIVGTGATAATLWLNSGAGLALQDSVVSSASGNAINLTYAGLCLIRDTIVTGTSTFTSCSSVDIRDSTTTALSFSWDDTDVLKPAQGQSSGLRILGGSVSTAVTLGGQAAFSTVPGTAITTLTALNLSVAASLVKPLISVGGQFSTVDFNTTTAAIPSGVLAVPTISFAGATCVGAAMTFRVASGATRQPINCTGMTIAQACTFTADALCDLNLRGAAFTSPTFTSANTGALGIGTIVPGILVVPAFSIAAGAATQAFPGGFTTTGTPVATASESAVTGGALSVSVSTTGVTVTPAANVGGNNAVAVVVWP